MDERPVSVVGAAGQTGVAVIGALARRGGRARAVVRALDSATTVQRAGAAEVVCGDLTSVESLAIAFAGSAAVHVIPPVFRRDEHELVHNAVVAASRAGVPRLVYHSVLHPNTPGLRHHLRKADAEHTVRESDLRWTILQPAMYAQTPIAFARLAMALNAADDAETCAVSIPYDPSSRFSVIDVVDVGEITANVLTGDGHEHATYELAGAAALSVLEMLEQMAAVVGRTLIAKQIRPTELPITPPGFTTGMCADFAAMCDHYDQHGLVGNGRVASALADRTLTPFAVVAERELASAAVATSSSSSGAKP